MSETKITRYDEHGETKITRDEMRASRDVERSHVLRTTHLSSFWRCPDCEQIVPLGIWEQTEYTAIRDALTAAHQRLHELERERERMSEHE